MAKLISFCFCCCFFFAQNTAPRIKHNILTLLNHFIIVCIIFLYNIFKLDYKVIFFIVMFDSHILLITLFITSFIFFPQSRSPDSPVSGPSPSARGPATPARSPAGPWPAPRAPPSPTTRQSTSTSRQSSSRPLATDAKVWTTLIGPTTLERPTATGRSAWTILIGPTTRELPIGTLASVPTTLIGPWAQERRLRLQNFP